jgi:3',5'-cyclic AMP phosphodiesterase CpdA
MKFIHISDLHLYTKGYSFKDLLYPKRFAGWLNYTFKRKDKFIDSIDKFKKIEEFIIINGIDGVVLSGDITCLGSSGEFDISKEYIKSLAEKVKYFAIIPGNHDYYIDKKLYNKAFGDLTKSDDFINNDQCGVIEFSDGVYIVLLNSVEPHPNTLLSSGKVSQSQLTSLTEVLNELKTNSENLVFICSHYGLRKQNGARDVITHGIVNDKELENLLAERDVYLLHGHIHHTYRYDVGSLKCYGAGGTTFLNREAFWLFECSDGRVASSMIKYVNGEYVKD